jgi:3-hydroxy-9,10-secoandrosta-1,3,5(10)-triene-9,17-dione monooxygenase
MNEMSTAGADRVQALDLVDRARQLVPAIAERAAEAETLRRVPDPTVREMEAAGLCQAWIPGAFGGHEQDLHTGLDTMFEIARGCASSSWCLGVWQQHSWIVALFPEAAQQSTLAADENFHIAAVLAPRGEARRVPGGFKVSGFWPFASGCEHGSWIMLGALVTDETGTPEPLEREIFGVPAANARLCLMPADTITIKGDWHAAGLAGTGSHSIVVDDVFVPEDHSLLIADAVEGRAPGKAVHGGTLFEATYYSFLHTALCGPAPGVAQGAIDHLIGAIEGKVLMPQNLIQTTMARTHRQIGEAEAKVHTARLLLRESADRIMEAAAARRQLDQTDRAICRRNGTLATHLCYEATELAFFAGGGSQLALASPVQRAMRDMHAIKAHYFMDLETAYELCGLTRLGQTPFTYVF